MAVIIESLDFRGFSDGRSKAGAIAERRGHVFLREHICAIHSQLAGQQGPVQARVAEGRNGEANCHWQCAALLRGGALLTPTDRRHGAGCGACAEREAPARTSPTNRRVAEVNPTIGANNDAATAMGLMIESAAQGQ